MLPAHLLCYLPISYSTCPPRCHEFLTRSPPRLASVLARSVWTSVLDSDPYQRDDRTDHESLPVDSGIKFGVNYWIHMWPFRSMQGGACDNQVRARARRGLGVGASHRCRVPREPPTQAYIQNWY